MTWTIWLGALPATSGWPKPVPAGWYGGKLTTTNQPLHMRTSDPTQAVVFTDKASVIQHVLDWRRLGYPCRAEPPIHLTI